MARTLAEIGLEIPTADGEALVEMRNRYRAIVKALWMLVSELNLVPKSDLEGGTDGIYGRTYHQTGQPTGEAKPHVLVTMLGDWSDRLAKLDESCSKLGLAERQVRVLEAEAILFAGVVDVMLGEAVPPEFHARARQVLAAELRKLDEGTS